MLQGSCKGEEMGRGQNVYLDEEDHDLLTLLAVRAGWTKHAMAKDLLHTAIQQAMSLGSQAQALEDAYSEMRRAVRANIERMKEEIAEKRVKRLSPDKQFIALLNRETEAREYVQGLPLNVRDNLLRRFMKEDPKFLGDKFRSFIEAGREP